MIAFDTMSQKQQNPSTDEANCAPFPLEKCKEDQPCEYQRNTNSVQQLIPPGTVFVVILSHVVRQSGHSSSPASFQAELAFVAGTSTLLADFIPFFTDFLEDKHSVRTSALVFQVLSSVFQQKVAWNGIFERSVHLHVKGL
jgi:hypothetical protein